MANLLQHPEYFNSEFRFPDEQWIPTLVDEKYHASTWGRVKSFKKNPAGVVMSPSDNGNGYLKLILNRKSYYVHRLVAEVHALNTNPAMYGEVNHLDGNKSNNRSGNIEWCNSSQNKKHAYKKGLNIMPTGDKRWHAKPVVQLTGEGVFIQEWGSATSASEGTGASIASITSAARKGHRAGGFRWKYAI